MPTEVPPVRESDDPTKDPIPYFNQALRDKMGVEDQRKLLAHLQSGARAIVNDLQNAIGGINERFRGDYHYVYKMLEQGLSNINAIKDVTANSLDLALMPIIEAQFILALPPASVEIVSPLFPRQVLQVYTDTRESNHTGLLADLCASIRMTRRDALAFHQMRTLLAVARGENADAAIQVTALMPKLQHTVVNLQGYSKAHLDDEDMEMLVNTSLSRTAGR